ncbi:hypothetical protein AB0M28_14350 [Streptomyces sp. NPDC051940]|uniref:hypothetical protein n=1 Tax=Streptomyces sp. NPDC051940 TaxID=3155675 RepID=UPI003442660D
MALLPLELVVIVCLVGRIDVPSPLRAGVELAMLALLAGGGTLLTLDYRRHRAAGTDSRSALRAAVADTVPAAVVKLTVHEVNLGTSCLRWLARRGPHGVPAGGTTVKYTAGQAMVVFGFLFVSVVETVALYFALLRWPAVHLVVTVLDVWGLYFIVALHASCVVRPHVIGADGSLRLRYGALVDVRIPAELIASAHLDRRYPERPLLSAAEDGTADLAVASQTNVTVRLTGPVPFTRALGQRGEASAFRFYADDPRSAVSALSAGAKRTGVTPGSAETSRTRSR